MKPRTRVVRLWDERAPLNTLFTEPAAMRAIAEARLRSGEAGGGGV